MLMIFALVVALTNTSASDADTEKMCRPYFGSACSEAVGRWLPRVPNSWIPERLARRTTVHDRVIDPAGTGPLTFLGTRGVFRGTHFVYGNAGPPQGHAVYDPVHHLAYYDEGCCSWHHVVIASNVKAPPKTIAVRSLIMLRTERGIQLGDKPSQIESIYGPAAFHPVTGVRSQETLSYYRKVTFRRPYSPCEERMTFLFAYGQLTALDIADEC